MNFKPVAQHVTLEGPCVDMLEGGNISGSVELPPYGVVVARRSLLR